MIRVLSPKSHCDLFRPAVAHSKSRCDLICRCTAQPSRRKGQIRSKLKNAIKHAQNLCFNFEDTKECHIAWDEVNELTRALHNEYPVVKEPERSELAKREYDV